MGKCRLQSNKKKRIKVRPIVEFEEGDAYEINGGGRIQIFCKLIITESDLEMDTHTHRYGLGKIIKVGPFEPKFIEDGAYSNIVDLVHHSK